MSDKRLVQCEVCGRTAACVAMKDGTVYRPFGWEYPHEDRPLVGLCGDCKARVGARDPSEGPARPGR